MATLRNGRGDKDVVVPRRDLAIDFANTVAWRGSRPDDSLPSFDAIVAWLGNAGSWPPTAINRLRKLGASTQMEKAKIWGDAIVLRESIYDLLHSAACNHPPVPADLRRLNEALAETPERSCVVYMGSELGWNIELRPTAAGILAPVLWSAGDLLTSSDRTRIRECGNPQCLWLFLDDSKNGTRRWCSMQACGNRAKAHRHYERKRQRGG
jgi:predicted RNA-binding Zn ribbon-like protein